MACGNSQHSSLCNCHLNAQGISRVPELEAKLAAKESELKTRSELYTEMFQMFKESESTVARLRKALKKAHQEAFEIKPYESGLAISIRRMNIMHITNEALSPSPVPEKEPPLNTGIGQIGNQQGVKEPPPLVCEWTRDESSDSWDTGCGGKCCFMTDGPIENGYLCCPKCGKLLRQRDSGER